MKKKLMFLLFVFLPFCAYTQIENQINLLHLTDSLKPGNIKAISNTIDCDSCILAGFDSVVNYSLNIICPADSSSINTFLVKEKVRKYFVFVNRSFVVYLPEGDSPDYEENYLYVFDKYNHLINKQILTNEYSNEGGFKSTEFIADSASYDIIIKTEFQLRGPAENEYSYSESSTYKIDDNSLKFTNFNSVLFDSPFFEKPQNWTEVPEKDSKELLQVYIYDSLVNPYGYQIAFYVDENSCTVIESTNKSGKIIDQVSLCSDIDFKRFAEQPKSKFNIKTYKGLISIMENGIFRFTANQKDKKLMYYE